jgi:DNA-binding NtrC family response regulator
MMRNSKKNDPVVIVSWISVNHHAAPLLMLLTNKHSHNPFYNKVKHLYLCWRDSNTANDTREYDALQSTKSALLANSGIGELSIHEVPWKSNSMPTDHRSIFKFAEVTLQDIRVKHPTTEIAIHLSPGTPAMHAVWLILGSTGAIKGPISLVQTADKKGIDQGADPVQIVDLALNTWLHRFRQTTPVTLDSHDSGHLWDPQLIRSPRLLAVIKQLEEWAPLRVPVLITGERGTGKTTAANFLRSKSRYQKLDLKDWPTVVCGQFKSNPQLARSELFGHKKGSFTGADKDKEGLLKKLCNDTLFLDEISDIDRETQRLLIAALEGRGFNPIGDAKTIKSNFRLVTATNQPLEKIVGNEIDPDFYDRIGILVANLPPLRQCREDLPQFWMEVLQKAVKNSGVEPIGWEDYLESRAITDCLQEQELPGNFRDLQKVAYHLLAALNSNRSIESIPDFIRTILPEKKSLEPLLPAKQKMRTSLPLERDVRDDIKEYRDLWTQAAMEKSNDNISKAAEYLNIPRKTLDHWLKK